MNTRTIIRFNCVSDIWPLVDKWAIENGFQQKSVQSVGRIYQKGIGFLTAPMMMGIHSEGQEIVIEAWVRVNTFMRAMALFIIPSEMGIGSGGFKLAVPRRIARDAINKLLIQIGQPLIP